MKGRIGRFVCTAVVLVMCTLVSVPAEAKTKSKCDICHHYFAKEGSRYCYSHTCHWRGKGDITCSTGIYTGKYCNKHICKEYNCDEPVYFDTDVQACRYHYRKYESQTTSKTSSASSASSSKSVRSTCKYSGCRNYAVSNKKGYCNKHYEQLFEKRDNYYDEDPESYYQDNKSMYKSRSEAYDDWEDEYEED